MAQLATIGKKQAVANTVFLSGKQRMADCSSSSDSDTDTERSHQEPSLSLVLGKRAFGRNPKQQPSYFRRLRTTNPQGKKIAGPLKRKTKDADSSDSDGGSGPPYRKRSRLASEPSEVRDADAKMIEPHPAVIFMRSHTPVKPCGRCKECRCPPCGECANCKNNEHLAERSHDRKRCTLLGCTRLSEEELERYRLAHDSADSVSKLESDLRTLRDKFMAVASSGTSSEELSELTATQETLMKRLQLVDRMAEAAVSEGAPDGFGCLLLSFQTLETERDRVARLIDRRTTRDSPEVMRTRRQLRNFYALTICNMVRMFANDVVARPHVSKLHAIADEYEKLVKSLPISN
jgi:hypothetical protein